MNYVLVRSPLKVVRQDKVGYGWKKVNFSEYQSAKDVITAIKANYENGIGRKANMVKQFFNLKPDDIVIVPLSKSFAIGKIEGQKFYDEALANDYASNLVSVKFFRDTQGNVLRISRKTLSTKLETRLKIKSAIANLNDFSDEIQKIITNILENGSYLQDSYLLQKQEEAIDNFKTDLLSAIVKGTVTLDAGGKGIEDLIAKLLKLEGYQSSVQAKNAISGLADVDIIGIKTDAFVTSTLLIQAKHHQGTTSNHGIKQLIEFDDENYKNPKKILITTAKVSDETSELARINNIQIIGGEEFMDILYPHIRKLPEKFKNQLGIIDMPMLVK